MCVWISSVSTRRVAELVQVMCFGAVRGSAHMLIWRGAAIARGHGNHTDPKERSGLEKGGLPSYQGAQRNPAHYMSQWSGILKVVNGCHTRSCVDAKTRCLMVVGERIAAPDSDRPIAEIHIRIVSVVLA